MPYISGARDRTPGLSQGIQGSPGLPGGTVSRFGQLMDAIYEASGKDHARIVYFVHLSLVKNTPTKSGTLRWSWRSGSTPNDYIFPRKIYPKPTVKPPGSKFRNYKTYYIWNNQPYLSYVNDGIAGKAGVTPKSEKSINFIQKSIDEGLRAARTVGFGA